MKKLLLFGGAFNPPHNGHKELLQAAMAEIRPDLTVVMPSGTSPHKISGNVKFAHRAAMAGSFKILGNVKVSGIEGIGRKKRNYTLQTIKRLQRMYPAYAVYLLIGGDMLKSFSLWSRYRRVLSMVTLVAASREEKKDVSLQAAVKQIAHDGGRVILLKTEPIVISSSELREKVRGDEDTSPYLPREVADYVQKHNLYKEW